MVKKAQFFDIDTILDTRAQAWIVDKKNPSIPIMKISRSDFNLYQNGIFKKQGNKIDFNGKTFWLPNDVANKLKIKLKNHKSSLSDLAISLQEFMNKSIIENLEFEINTGLLDTLKNSLDDIYVICSKQTKMSHESLINKMKEKLKKEGLEIKNFYFISETFYNQKTDDINHKKIRLLIQHLVGYKTEGDKFIDEQITRYDRIEFYDDNLDTLMLSKEVNHFLNVIWRKTEPGLAAVIKEDISDYKPQLTINMVSDNQVNRIKSEKVTLALSNLIKTFESFNLFESLEFKKQPSKGKTERYKVKKDEKEIGEVKWSSRMRGYAFQPPSDSEKEIKDFTSKLMTKWRKNRKKK